MYFCKFHIKYVNVSGNILSSSKDWILMTVGIYFRIWIYLLIWVCIFHHVQTETQLKKYSQSLFLPLKISSLWNYPPPSNLIIANLTDENHLNAVILSLCVNLALLQILKNVNTTLDITRVVSQVCSECIRASSK